jgi:hypothetical protein
VNANAILQAWHDFFIAEAGASAALAGLLFVAISINLTRILEFPSLPSRAVEALLALFSVLVVSSFALIPGQSLRAVGIEIGATGLALWLIQTVAMLRMWKIGHPRSRSILRVLANQIPPLPFVIAGALLMAGHPHGMYWTVPGALLSLENGLFGAWILLVEIQR